MIINCKLIANKIYDEIKKEIILLKQKYNIIPCFCIINTNNELSSKKFIDSKIKKANELGIECIVLNDIKTENELILKLDELNNKKNIHGYLIQLPLNQKINFKNIYEYIDIYKDLDGFSSLSTSRNVNNSNSFFTISCTALAIIKILEEINFNYESSRITILNRNNIIAKPLINIFLKNNATLTIAHSYTKSIDEIIKNTDLLITATGQHNLININNIHKDLIILDAGYHFLNNKTFGDCDFESIKDKVKFITPVPGGIGILTVCMIFYNLIKLIKQQIKDFKI